MAHYRLTVDEHVADALWMHPEPIELVDAEGRLLGTFTPSPEQRKAIYDQIWAETDVAELERLASAPDSREGCTTAELLEKLSKL
ncbi:MAG TPA: hypothetical protein VM165_22955 [Planctomycetaceae bacterium]|nr:hypothetical protein [Planctomycetaceae bacterium]